MEKISISKWTSKDLLIAILGVLSIILVGMVLLLVIIKQENTELRGKIDDIATESKSNQSLIYSNLRQMRNDDRDRYSRLKQYIQCSTQVYISSSTETILQEDYDSCLTGTDFIR